MNIDATIHNVVYIDLLLFRFFILCQSNQMNNMSLQSQLAMNPKHLFLMDGIGALVSVFLLGVVLVRFSELVGLDEGTLLLLASFPCIFAGYDFLCFFFVSESYSRFIIIIVVANSLYCLLSIGLAFYHSSTLTLIGWSYILVEVLVILTLSFVEYKVARSI
jgi:hypothetical protein